MAKSVLFWLFAFFMAYGQICLTASDQKPYCNTDLDTKIDKKIGYKTQMTIKVQISWLYDKAVIYP